MAKAPQATLASFSCVSTYDWEIVEFSKLTDSSTVTRDFLVPFPYKIFEWRLVLHPNGFDKKFEGSVSLFLNKVLPPEPVKISFSLSILDKDKRQVNKRDFSMISFPEDGIGPGCAELVSKSWLMQVCSVMVLP